MNKRRGLWMTCGAAFIGMVVAASAAGKDWMQFRKQLHRAKIDRIPFTVSFLEFKSKQIFPISSLRKLGSIKWSQKK